MKKSVIGKSAMWLTVIALSWTMGTSFAEGADAPAKKEKGTALQQLEAAAGKKIEDVKVPDVPKPTPVQSNYEVNKSTSSFDVNKSTATSPGANP